ncbi:phytanoyl-CoA dioxygenase [Pseudomonas luteola]|uniref:phytanoyl-CoA dioxygenase family protein n=1 Tax=Pseudomonas luteola TaxID=47886 RepID=UPI000F776B9C|nr:phytanoyl-CoA dioxygenase family protein [Pseudomonas luteola]RRW40398.1 phytanoyl-CoA dioxygenase [Pseudomonas luteola]
MNETSLSPHIFVKPDSIDIDVFTEICSQQTDPARYPNCTAISHNVVLYDAAVLRAAMSHDKPALQSELHDVLQRGPGVLVIRRAYTDVAVIDRHTEVFRQIFEDEVKHGISADHFAKAGINGRIWNVLQKTAEKSPDSFIEYYSNPLMALVAEAWLGPYYQVTAQVNVVHPGGQAQQPHRDYHLGFQSVEEAARYPIPVHVLSQYLTLQGAVAHSDMPLETGPTLLLPFSQQYDLGYLAWRRPDFIDYFHEKAVQLPLRKGDMLFFNPALFHAAGTNRTMNQQRTANLLQISSAFGKPMESVNRDTMVLALYPLLLKRLEEGELDEYAVNAVIAASADGYSFPTNLDTDPPLKGLAPQTGQHLLLQALQERWTFEQFSRSVAAQQYKRKAADSTQE